MLRERKPLITLLVAFALASCSKSGDRSRSVEQPREGESSETSAVARRLLSAVPSQALGVAVLDLPKNLKQLTAGGMIVPMRAEVGAELSKELGAFLTQRLGARIDDLSAVVAFVYGTDRPHGAAMIAHIEGKLNADSLRRELGGGDVVVGQHEDVLVIGDEPGVAAALGGLRTGGGLTLAAWLESETAGAPVAVAVRVAELAEKAKAPLGPLAGLRRAMAGFGSEAEVVGEADEDTLTGLKGQLELLMGMSLQAAKAQKEAASQPGQPLAVGAGAIIGYHYARNLAESIKPVIEGERLSISVPIELDATMPIVPLVGVMTAVAIPAFMKYIKRSKATEARVNLQRIARGAREYYLSTAKLPASVGATPAASCCEAGREVCPPRADLWAHPTWRALEFALSDPHRYAYRFENRGDEFVATAVGDLDCDNTMLTFRLVGRVSNGDVTLGAISADDELE